MLSLAMIRRSYAYTSLGFIAVWILLNVAYVNKLNTDVNAVLPHIKHGGYRRHRETAATSSSERTVVDGDIGKDVERIPLTNDELLDIEKGMQRHSFNVSASNLIPLDREVPNYKPHRCPKRYDVTRLPKASVIICFHNEALSTLLRTVYSVVRTTPTELLQEIILVDDASTYDYLGFKLHQQLKHFHNVKLIRARERLGIAKARIRGIRNSRGGVLVFLDSHCECAPGWIEPLLVAIQRNPKQIVCPEVDIINYKTFKYTKPDQSYEGSFDWELNLVLKPLSARQRLVRQTAADPIRTATMLGGIFAVNTRYFKSIGQFNMEMEIWGGENLELSFRVWICGGSIAILPCSRVGHVFRPVIPYGFPIHGAKATLHRNNQRVAESWMDGFKRFYYAAVRKGRTFNPVMVHSYNRFLRSKLNCKDFYWYLTNIMPEVAVPPEDAKYFGQIRHRLSGCIQVGVQMRLMLMKCLPQTIAQTFHLTPKGRLMHGKQCVTYHNAALHLLNISVCDEESLICKYLDSSQLSCRHPADNTTLCLESSSLNEPVYLHNCHTNVTTAQSWSFTHHLDLDLLHSH